MKRIGRRPFLIGGSLLSACGGAIAEDPQPGPSRTPPTPTTDLPVDTPPAPRPGACVDREPSSPIRALHGVSNSAPYPSRTLYSFTTAAQVAEIRQGTPVFSKVTTDSGHRGYLFDFLEAAATKGDEAAKVLAGPMFEKGRFAWPFLAGTRISPEDYGDEIIAFTLAPDALLATVTVKWGVSFRDAKNNTVDTSNAMATPERIGAIHFVNDSSTVADTLGTHCTPGTLDGALIYREFYLGNLDMLAEWSLGTQAIVDHLADEVADLRALAKDLDCSRGRLPPSCDAIVRSWDYIGTSRLERFLASLAFASPIGQTGLMPSDLSALADDLEALRFTPDPLVVNP